MDKKISEVFEARLAGMASGTIVRAIVMIQVPPAAKPSGRRMTTAERMAVIEAVKQSAQTAFPAIDKVLQPRGGKRLSETASAIGSIIVEATPFDIRALAALEQVKAILEDQPVSKPSVRQA